MAHHARNGTCLPRLDGHRCPHRDPHHSRPSRSEGIVAPDRRKMKGTKPQATGTATADEHRARRGEKTGQRNHGGNPDAGRLMSNQGALLRGPNGYIAGA